MMIRQSRLGLGIILLCLSAMQARAEILWEYWTGIPGTSVADLTSQPNYPDHPTDSDLLTSFEIPVNWADNFGSRVRGYLIAPVSGAYTFWIASDDNSELWLSTDGDPENAELIASVPEWTSSRQWDRYASQKSQPIQLIAGQWYYIEALQKEGSGGDNLAVGWAQPGQSTAAPSEVIPDWVLIPWTGYDPAYNRSPSVLVPTDRSIVEAPAAIQLTAQVRDDGKPLPANPENPDQNDPNKLRWSWSVISAPITSDGVVWFGSPTAGEAFTYDGSEYAPDTPFVCDPCALFDTPGLYVLEFRASDGDKETVRQVNVSIRSTGIYRQLGYMYLSPVPFAEYVAAQARMILVRFSEIRPQDLTNLSTFVTVTGSRSGLHSGQTKIASDGRTVIFTAETSFEPQEVVTVRLSPEVSRSKAGLIEPYEYQFVVSTHMPDPPLITARGQIEPYQTKEMAFDEDPQTQWADGIVPDGSGQSSWIQFVYSGHEETHIITEYALTSAADSPSNDPADWLLYGVDESGQLIPLDAQTNQTFPGRGVRKTYPIENASSFRGYRLEIIRVRDPLNANAVQLAELELIRATGSIFREYWLDIPGDAVSDLTSHPDFPSHPSGSDQMSSFEAPTDWADNYGTRMRGFITAPKTGEYTFWLATDDGGELWLSPTEDPAQKVLIAEVPEWASSREWNKFAQQKSAPISLIAGQKYYIEALQKEQGGGDNLAVGWAKPGQGDASPSEIIPGEILSPWQDDTVTTLTASSVSLDLPTDENDRPGLSVAAAEPHEPIVFALATDGVGGEVLSNGVSIPSDFPTPVITVKRDPAPGYIFLENAGEGGSRYTMILDNNGEPLWYRRGGGREFKVQKNGMITWAAFTGVDKNFNYVRGYSAANAHATDDHELEVLEDGSYLLIGFHDQSGIDVSRYLTGASTNATVHATALQEFTASGELIFQFRAWDHFDIADVQPVVENPRGGNVRFSHMNAIDVDEDGHLLISSRHISEVTKINRDTGQIIWRLGGAHSDFVFVNDPLDGFSCQHDISALGNGRYMIFDNGNGHSPSVSRAVEYQLDLEAMTATLVWEFRNTPDRYTHYMGNAQRLHNGNTLINFVLAGYPKVTEVDRDGVKQFEMNLQPGSDLYRAFRFPWDGVVAQPYLVAESHESNIALIFNKFGDPNVAAYRIYGGTSPHPTTLLLETSSTLAHLTDLQNRKQYYFRVTAVSDSGVESPYSNEESLFVNFQDQPGVELVRNGDFSQGQDEWTWSTAGAQAEWTVSVGVCSIAITNAGASFDAIQLQQAGLPLTQGRSYVFEFDASAAGPRLIEAKVGQGQSPFTNYSRIGYTYLTPQPKHFRYTFTMNEPTDADARIIFSTGTSDLDVWIDNVSLMME